MDKTIIIMVGHTGAGKTTISTELGKRYSLPIISFANCGKQFARNNNYEHIRDCWNSMQKQKFREGVSKIIIESVEKELSHSKAIVIDGLYDNMTLLEIQKHYGCVKSVYLVVPKVIRFARIAERCGYTIVQVIKENRRKEQIKTYLGIDKVLSNADYFINATKSVESIVQDIYNRLFVTEAETQINAHNFSLQYSSYSFLQRILRLVLEPISFKRFVRYILRSLGT